MNKPEVKLERTPWSRTAQGGLSGALAVLALLCSLPAAAEWSHDTTQNNPVCAATGLQGDPSPVSDGQGGTIIAWRDQRFGEADLYVQRLDARGVPLWTADGVGVCTAAGAQYPRRLVSDGAGGAVVVWEDYRSGVSLDIYAQRLDASGLPLWTADGVAVCTAAANQSQPQLIGDGAGGAIAVWQDYRAGNNDIHAQRLDAAGIPLWTANGIALCNATADQSDPQLAGDGAGGAIIAWQDYRSGATSDIYAQRVSPAGAALWTANGLALCTATASQAEAQLVGDGQGGVVVTWYDNRSGNNDIYAQRVSGSGTALWTANGVALCSAAGNQQIQQMVADTAGGAIVAWNDYRAGATTDIYAQRVSASGTALWTANGIALCTAPGSQFYPQLVDDGAGGAIVTWRDPRSGQNDIYAQQIDASGMPLWASNGLALCTAPGEQMDPQLVADGANGAIICWQDARSGIEDVYAQRVERNGYLGYPSPVLTSAMDHPYDQGGQIILDWTASYLDVWTLQGVDYYSVWRRYGGTTTSEGPRKAPPSLPPPSGFENLGRQGWIYTGEVQAIYFEEYGYVAPSFGDSTPGETIWTEYIVLAHNAALSDAWISVPLSGFSVDDLAPGAPLSLTAQPSGSDVSLSWLPSGQDDEDLGFYRIYRGTVPGFVPDEQSLIGTSAEPQYLDAAPGGGTWYYRVSGEDVHGNEGSPSDEASATISTVSATLSCVPGTGTLPFATGMTVTLTNTYFGQLRRLAGRIDVRVGNGQFFSNWRSGFTNVGPGSTFVTSWNQGLPSLGSLVGQNEFDLAARDVTPSPYNQPPYPPSGDTAADACTVVANAP